MPQIVKAQLTRYIAVIISNAVIIKAWSAGKSIAKLNSSQAVVRVTLENTTAHQVRVYVACRLTTASKTATTAMARNM